jgi:hypothetical protein
LRFGVGALPIRFYALFFSGKIGNVGASNESKARVPSWSSGPGAR